MDDQQTVARGEPALVKGDGLAREQVGGDAVTGERVQDQDVILGAGLFERLAAVALDEVDLAGRLGDKGEVFTGDANDLRIDVPKIVGIALAGVGGKDAGPETDHADAHGRPLSLQALEDATDAGAFRDNRAWVDAGLPHRRSAASRGWSYRWRGRRSADSWNSA